MCAVVVARDRQDAAMLRGADEIAAVQRIARAIDARTLAVPHAEHAIDALAREGVELLRTIKHGRRQILIDAGLEADVAVGQQLLPAPGFAVQATQRRAAIAGDETAGVEAHGAVEPRLLEQHTDQRLDAGQQHRLVELGEPAFECGRWTETAIHMGHLSRVKPARNIGLRQQSCHVRRGAPRGVGQIATKLRSCGSARHVIAGTASTKQSRRDNRLEPNRMPLLWDVEADVVVVGFGAAGVAAAVTAHDLGAKVVILEKAPEGQHGGNTRVAGQGYLNTSSVEPAAAYLTALCGPYAVPPAMVRVWAQEMRRNNAWLTGLGGDPQEHQHPPVGIEFPDLPGADCVHKFHDGPTYGYSFTWKRFESLVLQRPIAVLYETPARQLIQHDISKEILGVRAQQPDRAIAVKARRAVVLTCGGFENNQEMIRNYLPGVPCCYTSGSPYNEGDGISMAMSVGADLWHMNNYAGPSMALKVPEVRTSLLHAGAALQQADAGRHDRGGSRCATLRG